MDETHKSPSDFSLQQLKEKLRALGLQTSGVKQELIARLMKALRETRARSSPMDSPVETRDASRINVRSVADLLNHFDGNSEVL